MDEREREMQHSTLYKIDPLGWEKERDATCAYYSGFRGGFCTKNFLISYTGQWYSLNKSRSNDVEVATSY